MSMKRGRGSRAKSRSSSTSRSFGSDPRSQFRSIERSRLMASVRQRGTTPELAVRRLARKLGVRFEENGRYLPGSPDLVILASKRAVFVHGCFWHRHSRCKAATTPKGNRAFWAEKFDLNVRRDRRKVRQLRLLGYRVLTVWECQVKPPADTTHTTLRLRRFFGLREK